MSRRMDVDSLADVQDQLGRDNRSSKGTLRGHERLYDAYNELHQLAQSFDKPFDAPAILVVGHQTDGKSALVEALMGFQFNSVGGGTKTRRPIAIHMKYNGACATPACYLVAEDGSGEQEMSLPELQAYIDADNEALERESRFASREITVRMEYRHCPNLTIIDTPGLICPAPGKRNCPLQACAVQVEEIVRAKAQVPEYVILCLEDCSDWSNATTRRLVMQVDPTLSRSVLVSTKLDTRIPQFARPADCEMFLRPSALEGLAPLGEGPFFTSVPSGRVGPGSDCVFPTQDSFRERLAEREAADTEALEAKMGRRLTRPEREHIGVGALRRFLEQLLQRRYLDAVPAIVPLLEREQRDTAGRIEVVRRELAGMCPEQLKDQGRSFVDGFLARLQQLLRGTIAAPPDKWGETLADEHARGGAFVGSGSRATPVPDGLPNAAMRLYGGAQFHRAMTEFRLVVGSLPCPELSHEEIVNACGLDTEAGHDGTNYTRAACVIAVAKARQLLEPYVHQLGYRLAHVLRRLLHISLALMAGQGGGCGMAGEDSWACGGTSNAGSALGGSSIGGGGGSSAAAAALTEQFAARVSRSFHTFIEEVEGSCKGRCLEDLASTTRYVSWSLHTRGNSRHMRQLLGRVRVTGGEANPLASVLPAAAGGKGGGSTALSREPSVTGGQLGGSGSLALTEMLEATLWNRQLVGVSEDIVRALVATMFEGIRDHLVQAAELKFNCFFLMPLVDAFPGRMRRELEAAYEQGLDGVFDAGALRCALEARQGELEEELHRVERLQRKFHSIHSTLVAGPSLVAGPLSRAIDVDASLMFASSAGPLFAMGQQGQGGQGQGMTAAGGGGSAAGTPAGASRLPGRAADMGLRAMAAATPGVRKPTASAAGAASIAAAASGMGFGTGAAASAGSGDQPLASARGATWVAGSERDRAERDAKDKDRAVGSVADKVAAVQLQQQAAVGAAK